MVQGACHPDWLPFQVRGGGISVFRVPGAVVDRGSVLLLAVFFPAVLRLGGAPSDRHEVEGPLPRRDHHHIAVDGHLGQERQELLRCVQRVLFTAEPLGDSRDPAVHEVIDGMPRQEKGRFESVAQEAALRVDDDQMAPGSQQLRRFGQ